MKSANSGNCHFKYCFFFFLKIDFVYVRVPCVCGYQQRPEKDGRYPGVGVTHCCDPLKMHAGSQTLALSKSSNCS